MLWNLCRLGKNDMNPLLQTREVGLDIIGTMHIAKAFNEFKEWDCKCAACEYVRKEPRLVDAIYKGLKKNSK